MASTWRPSVAPVPLQSLATYVPRPGHVVVTKMPKRARSSHQFRSWFAAMRSVSESHRATGPPCSPAPLRRRSLLWPRLPRVHPRPSRHALACCDAVRCARRLVLRLRDLAPALVATDRVSKCNLAKRTGASFIVPIWGSIWLVVTSSQRAASAAHEGRFLTLARGPAVPGHCPSPATDCPGHGLVGIPIRQRASPAPTLPRPFSS